MYHILLLLAFHKCLFDSDVVESLLYYMERDLGDADKIGMGNRCHEALI